MRSCEIDGPSFEGEGDLGTWATTSPGGAEAIYSVNPLAKKFSSWRDGTKVAGLSIADDGVHLSGKCVSG